MNRITTIYDGEGFTKERFINREKMMLKAYETNEERIEHLKISIKARSEQIKKLKMEQDMLKSILKEIEDGQE